jgi:hypothetical protein
MFKQGLVVALCLALLNLSSPRTAEAAIVGTLQAVEASSGRAHDLAVVNATLQRQQVREQMVALGADPAAVADRVARLSDQELRTLAGQMEQAPAGGDALAIVGIVFVVLIILELVGVIDIFKKA